jgi:4-hydroxy-3-polyprenylbenzoate decarboxylase
MKRLVVAITGASGALYGVRLLHWLREAGGVQTHLMISEAGALSLHHELGITRKEVEVRACVASGSFPSEGMIIAPCSMKTLASVAHGLCDNLISRAADVMLKERRRLVLMVRETPFNLAHLRNMTAVTEMGGIIFPPLPALYQKPADITEMVDHTVGRVLDLFGVEQTLAPQWQGLRQGR